MASNGPPSTPVNSPAPGLDGEDAKPANKPGIIARLGLDAKTVILMLK
jgi:hypothetical protein